MEKGNYQRINVSKIVKEWELNLKNILKERKQSSGNNNAKKCCSLSDAEKKILDRLFKLSLEDEKLIGPVYCQSSDNVSHISNCSNSAANHFSQKSKMSAPPPGFEHFQPQTNRNCPIIQSNSSLNIDLKESELKQEKTNSLKSTSLSALASQHLASSNASKLQPNYANDRDIPVLNSLKQMRNNVSIPKLPSSKSDILVPKLKNGNLTLNPQASPMSFKTDKSYVLSSGDNSTSQNFFSFITPSLGLGKSNACPNSSGTYFSGTPNILLKKTDDSFKLAPSAINLNVALIKHVDESSKTREQDTDSEMSSSESFLDVEEIPELSPKLKMKKLDRPPSDFSSVLLRTKGRKRIKKISASSVVAPFAPFSFETPSPDDLVFSL